MRKTVIIGALLVAGTAALAKMPADEPKSERVGPRGDPNEIVCVNQSEIGTRLSRRRVCRTRAEWDQLAQQTRQVVERAQFEKQTSEQ